MTVTINGTTGITTPGVTNAGNDVISGNSSIAGALQVGGVTTNVYPLVSGTAWTYTSGTPSSIDFTGIPSWVKRITVLFNGLTYATNGAGVVQIGSGSLTTSGYTGTVTTFTTTPTTVTTGLSNGFGNLTTSANATTIIGTMIINNMGSNTWVCLQQTNRIGDSTTTTCNGSVTLSGSIDRLSVVATTSTFDGGTVNILYE